MSNKERESSKNPLNNIVKAQIINKMEDKWAKY